MNRKQITFLIVWIFLSTATFGQQPTYLSQYPELKELLKKNNVTANGTSWKVLQSSDTACSIEWKSKSLTRQTTLTFDYGIARNFRVEWENNSFLILRAHYGSDAWFNVYLPLNSKTKEFIYDNPLAFDKTNNIVILEGEGDTIMTVVNLQTNKVQPIIEKGNKCSSVFNHYCIDSILVKDKKLYFHWTIPNRIDSKKYVERIIELKV